MNVKVCGITCAEDAAAAVAAGADYLGFIFVAGTPRYISPDAAGSITRELPSEVRRVGVFVDAAAAEIRRVAAAAGLDTIQLHGDEPVALIAALAEFDVIKAVSLQTAADLAVLDRYPGARLLVDAATGRDAGAGETGDWDLARAAAASHPIFLAGGLCPDNVAAAIGAVQPDGVDVSTGVERCKGRKDPAKLRAFIAAARGAADA
jgi:phosphoribosylanthranilate isomerase